MRVQQSYRKLSGKGTLTIVPTPIGNLEDITLRGLKSLQTADVIYCEDTRVTQKLLNHFEINKKLKSYHKFNEDKKIEELLSDLDRNLNIAFVSDAGMPGINDPGFWAIKKAKEAGFNVVVLPGASAFLVAVVQSGFSIEEFVYYGFLPKKKMAALAKIDEILKLGKVGVIYITPHELIKKLEYFIEIDPQVEMTVLREISKLYEEIVSGKPAEIIKYYQENPLKGELVLVVNPLIKKNEYTNPIEGIQQELSNGLSEKEAIKKVAKALGVEKNKIYQLWLEEKKKNE